MTAPATEKDPAAVETAGLEIAIQRQQKPAPIPAEDAPYCAGSIAHIDIGGLCERHVKELRRHAEKLLWQMENDERPAPPHGWTCFHCAQTFWTWASASAHFGDDPKEGRPICVEECKRDVPTDVRQLAGHFEKVWTVEYEDASVGDVIARVIMQDRADRASQEERIREDERESCARIADDAARNAGASADRSDARTASGASVLAGYIFARTEAEAIAKAIRLRARLRGDAS